MISRRRASADEGASLLLVLLFVMIVGVVLAGLLPYTQAGINEAATARDVRTLQSAVDGAVQGAIGQARLNTDACVGNDRPVYTAPSYPDPVTPAKAVNVTVTCAPGNGGSSGASSDVPPYAIVTTGGPLVVSGNRTLLVNGGIYATGAITTGSGSGSQLLVDVTGPVYTTHASAGSGYACDSGLVIASAFPPSGTPHCPSQAGDPDFPDTSAASYPSSLGTSVPTPTDPLGTCTSASSIVTFVPGYYSETPQVDPVSCKNNHSNVWWFSPCAAAASGGSCPADAAPGTYYLDFPDGSYDHYSSSQATWDLDPAGVRLIGGTLNANGTACDPSGTGVQVVLGGPTQIETGNKSSINLCASKTAPGSSVPGSRQRIALYGIPNDYPSASQGPRSQSTDGPAAPTATADVAGDSAFTTRSGSKQHGDSQVAEGDFAGTTGSYGVSLSSYSTPANGSLVTHAWLEVTHAETDNKIQPTVTISYPAPGGPVVDTCSLPATGSAALETDEIDLMSMKSGDCTQSGSSSDFAGSSLRYQLMRNMTVTYEATATKKAGSVSNPARSLVDGVELKTQSVMPGLEPERLAQGQAASSFYAFTNSDRFNPADGNTVFVGTVFTPQGPIWAAVHNNPLTIFRRGVVVQSLTVNANASFKQTEAPFALPSTATSRYVLFTATVSGKTMLRALVHFVDYTPPTTDPNDSSQYFPGRAVVVKEWTNLR